MKGLLKGGDLLYPELSYKMIGAAFEVFNELGYGHAEKYYQKAMSVELRQRGITFSEQFYAPLKFKGEVIGRLYMDFLIENQVVVELKKRSNFSKKNIDQVHEYLLSSGIQLAILINFTANGVIAKRVVNAQLVQLENFGNPNLHIKRVG